MFARLLALVCLSVVGPSIGLSEPVTPGGHEVVVYLRSAAHQPVTELAEMERESAALLESIGYDIEFRGAGDDPETTGFLSVVELRGSCEARSAGSTTMVENGAKLASTAVTDGKILPFTWINCQTVSNFLNDALQSVPEAQQHQMLGRAMGRILAHELYHVLTETPTHDESGAFKSAFAVSDVLADHLDFAELSHARALHTVDSSSSLDSAAR